MKIDMGLRGHDLQALGGEAAAYERLGIDGLWSYETAHDPFLPLLVAAQNTARVEPGHRDRRGLRAQPVRYGADRLGPAAGERRAAAVGAGNAGAGACGAPLRGRVRASGGAHRRLHPLPPRDLGHFSDRREAGLRGPLLPLHADQRLLQSRPDRAPGHQGLAGRRRRAHGARRRRGGRRLPRPPAAQPGLRARRRAAGDRRRRARRGPRSGKGGPDRLAVHRHRRERDRARRGGALRPPADRVLRLDAELPAVPRLSRLRGAGQGAQRARAQRPLRRDGRACA